ncbi:DoxX family protein [Flaviaesturariibacter amylovorans]|uniref:DoxX family protein n=1 Tax=Flaviaesturariibacter amylovorans TaxID=1084520 RepID=A0ABP8G5T5_9BACT
MRSFSLRAFLFGQSLPDDRTLNIGWLLFRFYLGLSLAIGAGLPKIRDGFSPDWFVRMVDGMGFDFPSPVFWAALASWGEFLGGICIAFGILTRPMALQLAFQFFIISFIWYGEPEPLVGMYYQQLFFWCFLLVLFAGGGRFSVDRWLAARQFPLRRLRLATGIALGGGILLLGTAAGKMPIVKRTVVYRVQVPGPAPKVVAVRGGDAPLSWETDRALHLLPGTDMYTDTVTYNTAYGFTDVKFVRDGQFELDQKDNRRVQFNGKDTVVYSATFDVPDTPTK